MKTEQIQIREPAQAAIALNQMSDAARANLVLVFGAPSLLKDSRLSEAIRTACPTAILAGCSTAGEITNAGIADGTAVITLVRFDRTGLDVAETPLAGMDDSAAAGRRLGSALAAPDLRAVLVFAQGVDINGSALIDGLRETLGSAVAITGGLAGDGTRFAETVVLAPSGASTAAIVAVGLRGDALVFSHGSFGGWEPFGTLRKVTRASSNVLHELDGKPALDVYKTYLGDYARELPSSGLLFPFEMIDRTRSTTGVIRTILGVDEAAGSLTLAGDIDPEGYLQLMHASADRLVGGAEAAARAAHDMAEHPDGGLGILVSCVGRKLVIGDRIDEEIEAVADVFGQHTLLTGFYSYGEISPYAPGASCRLHNQTMTVTWIAEAA
jgi:hypothetical protein